MSWKLASTVRRGAFGKVPLDGNSLGVYPTVMVLVVVLALSCRIRRGNGCTTQALALFLVISAILLLLFLEKMLLK